MIVDGSKLVGRLELSHEVHQRLHALHGHGVVDGSARAANAAVALGVAVQDEFEKAKFEKP
jgi:hypothetical protein